MNAKTRNAIKKKANRITAKYSRWLFPQELQEMYTELAEIGVTTGAIYNSGDCCEWYIDGEEVTNSLYIYKVYKDYKFSKEKNEYTIYFS